MAEIINLRRERRARERAEAAALAAENRALHGRTKAEREHERLQQERERRRLDQRRREP